LLKFFILCGHPRGFEKAIFFSDQCASGARKRAKKKGLVHDTLM